MREGLDFRIQENSGSYLGTVPGTYDDNPVQAAGVQPNNRIRELKIILVQKFGAPSCGSLYQGSFYLGLYRVRVFF